MNFGWLKSPVPWKRAASVVQSQSFSASNARQAQSIALRAMMRSRNTLAGAMANGVTPDGLTRYQGVWIPDYVWMAESYPGWFTAAKLRATFDTWLTSIGQNGSYLAALAEHTNLTGAWNFGTAVQPSYNNGGYVAQLMEIIYERGDHTVASAANLDKVAAAMDYVARDGNGALWTDPASGNVIAWGFEDSQIVRGAHLTASAVLATGYQALARMASSEGLAPRAATYTASASALINGIRGLRRADGFYNTAGNQAHPSVPGTAYVVAYGLCTPAERKASADAIASAYQAGTISQNGGIRWLVSPHYYDSSSTAQDTYQNGGYWLGPWTRWVAWALASGGHKALAQQIMQEAVSEVVRQHGVNAEAPWEWHNGAALSDTHLYGAAGAFLSTTGDTSSAGAAPSLSTVTPTLTDDFSANTAANYVTNGTFAISTGRLRNTTNASPRYFVSNTSGTATNVTVSAVYTSAAFNTRNGAVVFRWVDANNYSYLALGGTVAGVYDVVAGTPTQLGALFSTGFTATNNADYVITATAIGTTVTAVVNGRVFVRTTTRNVAGRCGLAVTYSTSTSEVNFDSWSWWNLDGLPAIPAGYVLEWGGTNNTGSYATGAIAGDPYPVGLATANLRDGLGNVVSSAAGPVTITVP